MHYRRGFFLNKEHCFVIYLQRGNFSLYDDDDDIIMSQELYPPLPQIVSLPPNISFSSMFELYLWKLL